MQSVKTPLVWLVMMLFLLSGLSSGPFQDGGTYTRERNVRNINTIDTVSSPTRGPVIFSDDMEPGGSSWLGEWHHGGTEDEWELGTPGENLDNPADPGPAPHSGDYCWGTDLDGYYNKSTNSWLMTPRIDLSTMQYATISFWIWYDVTAVNISTNETVENNTDILEFNAKCESCGTWSTIAVFNHTTYRESEWIYVEFNLTGLVPFTSTVYFSWNLIDRDNVSEDNGAYLDDVVVRGSPRPDMDIAVEDMAVNVNNLSYAEAQVVPVGEMLTVYANVTNLGLYTVDSATVHLQAGSWGSSVTVTAIAPGQWKTAYFYPTLERSGDYTFTVTVMAEGDTVGNNNELSQRVTARDYVLVDDFSSDTWSHSSETEAQDLWHVENSAYVCSNSTGSYNNLMVDVLESPVFTARYMKSLTLEISHSGDFEWADGKYWDGGFIEVWNGSGWELLDLDSPVAGEIEGGTGNLYAGKIGFVGSYSERTDYINLTPYIGGEISLRFVFASDSVNTRSGWRLYHIGIYGVEMDNYDFKAQSVSTDPIYLLDSMPSMLPITVTVANEGIYTLPQLRATVKLVQNSHYSDGMVTENSSPETVEAMDIYITGPAYGSTVEKTVYMVADSIKDIPGNYTITFDLEAVDGEYNTVNNHAEYSFRVRTSMMGPVASSEVVTPGNGWSYNGSSVVCSGPGNGIWTASMPLDLRNANEAVLLLNHSYSVTQGSASVLAEHGGGITPLPPANPADFGHLCGGSGITGVEEDITSAFDLSDYVGDKVTILFALSESSASEDIWILNSIHIVGLGEPMLFGLSISGIDDTYTVYEGEELSLTAHITNTGNTENTYTMETYSEGWNASSGIDSFTLQPGESADVPLDILVPATASPGEKMNITLRISGTLTDYITTVHISVREYEPFTVEYGSLKISMMKRGDGTAYIVPYNSSSPENLYLGPYQLVSTFHDIRDVSITYTYTVYDLQKGSYEYLEDTMILAGYSNSSGWHDMGAAVDTDSNTLSGLMDSSVFAITAVKNMYPYAVISNPMATQTFYQGDYVTFSAVGSTDPDGTIEEYSWESDISGSLGTGQMITVPLNDVGTHTITLTVTDNMGSSDSDSIQIVVKENLPPAGAITINRTTVKPGDRVYMYSTFKDPEGGALSYMWDMGDGTIYTEPSPTHVYTREGKYTVKLTVSDGKNSVSDTVTITVSAGKTSYGGTGDRSMGSALAHGLSSFAGLLLLVIFAALVTLYLRKRYAGANMVTYLGFLIMFGVAEYDTALGRPDTYIGPTGKAVMLIGILIAILGGLVAARVKFRGWYSTPVFMLGMTFFFLALEGERLSVSTGTEPIVLYALGILFITIAVIISVYASRKVLPVDEEELRRRLEKVTVSSVGEAGEEDEETEEGPGADEEEPPASEEDEEKIAIIHLRCPECGVKGRIAVKPEDIKDNKFYLECPNCGAEGVFELPEEIREAL